MLSSAAELNQWPHLAQEFSAVFPNLGPQNMSHIGPGARPAALPGQESYFIASLLSIVPSPDHVVSLTRAPRQLWGPILYSCLGMEPRQQTCPSQYSQSVAPLFNPRVWAVGSPQNWTLIASPTGPRTLPADTSKNPNEVDWYRTNRQSLALGSSRNLLL